MKNSCATPGSPTRSLINEDQCPRRSGATLVSALAALAALAWAGGASAHGDPGDVLPPQPGLSLSVDLALRALHSRRTLPSTRLDGVLLKGDAGTDPEGLQLQHGAAAAAWRLTDAWGAYAALGAHGKDPARLEAAWLQWRHDAPTGSAWLVTAGRQAPAVGPVLAAERDAGSFALPALAQRAAWDHHGGDDAVQVGWRSAPGNIDLALDAGLWRGRLFPGGRHGGSSHLGTSLHAGATWQGWSLDAAWMRLHPRARGASTSPAAGHSHGSPQCDARLFNVICFAGRADVLGGSLRWNGADSASGWPLELSVAGWWRQDKGSLESANGMAAYTGRSAGAWADALWQWRPAISLLWRHERLQPRHRLEGSGARLLAAEARLQHAASSRRDTLRLAWQARPGVQLSLEVGEERVAGRREGFAALRAVFSGNWVTSVWP